MFETTFNELILKIEEWVKDKYTRPDDIARSAAAFLRMNLRSVYDAFKLVTDMTLLQYVKERKMMAAYSYLIGNEKLDIAGAYEIYGSGGHQSFNKSFMKFFGITPSQAFEKKDPSLILPPLDWKNNSTRKKVTESAETELNITDGAVFGLPRSRYEEIVEAIELSALYDLDTIYSNVAFETAHKQKWSLSDTFRFVGEIRDLIAVVGEDKDVDKVGFCHHWLNDLVAQFFFFDCKIPMDNAYFRSFSLPKRLSAEDIVSLKPDLIHRFYKSFYDFSFYEFEKIYQYYMENSGEDWQESDWEHYLDLVWEHCSPEEALKEVEFDHWLKNADVNDLLDADVGNLGTVFDDSTDDFEKWAKENMGSIDDLY